MEQKPSPELDSALGIYSYLQVEKFLKSINRHFRQTLPEDPECDVVDFGDITDDEVSALLELYGFVGTNPQREKYAEVTSALLRGYPPHNVMINYEVSDPARLKGEVTKEVGMNLAKIYNGQGSPPRIREVVDALLVPSHEAVDAEVLPESLGLEEVIRTLFDEGKLEKNEAIILLHHFGYVTSPAYKNVLDAVYQRTAARLLRLKALNMSNLPYRLQHHPKARLYARRMLKSGHTIQDISKLPGGEADEERVEQLLAVGLKQLTDPNFD